MSYFKQVLIAIILFVPFQVCWSSAHSDSPVDVLSPATNASDFFFFRSWEDPNKVIAILNVFPLQAPEDGPSTAKFDDNALYRINIDNDMDGIADDIVYQVEFETEVRDLESMASFPFPLVGHPNMTDTSLQGISALDGPGSEGLRERQIFSVREIRDRRSKVLFEGQRLVAAPRNAGPLITPDYEALAADAIYSDHKAAVRVFAGPRAESTYADVAAFYAGLDFDRIPPVMSESEDTNDSISPYGRNRFLNTNVLSIVLEIPIDHLTADGKSPDLAQIPFLGGYGSVFTQLQYNRLADMWATLRKHPKTLNVIKHENWFYEQRSRVANPTLNTLVTDYKYKDAYNRTAPHYDAQYAPAIGAPGFAGYLEQVFGLPVPPEPRLDILSVLYKYPGQELSGTTCGDPCADLLHLNIKVPPTQPSEQSRLGALLSSDPGGLPNGRRPNDDVYDITLRAFGGPAYIVSRIGDGQNFANGIPGAGSADGPGYGSIEGNRLDVTENGIVKEFPYLATPHAPK